MRGSVPLLFCAALVALYVLAWDIAPSLSEVQCRFGEAQWQECSLPLRIRSESRMLQARIQLDLPERHPNRFHLVFAGCLQELKVNGQSVPQIVLPICHEPLGVLLDLYSLVHPGKNDIVLSVEHPPHPVIINVLALRTSRTDRASLFISLVLLVLIALFGAFVIHSIPATSSFPRLLLWLFLAGVLLRVLYVIETPYWTRAYDWQGHVQYLAYVSEHWRIPPAQFGWQTYQPPLYYFLGNAWIKLVSLPGSTFDGLLSNLQMGSLLLSVAAYALALSIGTILFPDDHQRHSLFLYSALLAVFPTFIFTASRISNDVLLYPVSLAFLLFLLRWWQEGRTRDWMMMSVLIGLGLLVKSSVLLLLPAACLCLFLRKNVCFRRRGALLLSLVGIVTAIAGWLFVQRFILEGETSIVGNAHRLAPVALDETVLSHFLVFNPLRVLQCPFIVDLSSGCGREYFFEYLFRSAHVGGFRFAAPLVPLIEWITVSSLALLPFAVVGIGRSIRLSGHAFPLFSVFSFLLLGHMAYRVIYPFSFNQDFRFSLLLIVPLTYYVVIGFEGGPGWVRSIGLCIAGIFLASGTAFILLLLPFS